MNDSEQTLLDFSRQVKLTPEYLASQGLNESFPKRFWAKVDKNGPVQPHCPELGPCWMFTGGHNRYGYIGYGVYRDGMILAHRASWILNLGPIPKGLHCLHHCDNTRCVNPAHLWLGTHQDNMDDRTKKGRLNPLIFRGEQHGMCRITADTVRAIRTLYHSVSGQDIAKMFGISPQHVSGIVHRRFWKHIK